MNRWTLHNSIELISDAETFYSKLCKSIDQAEETIFFETYIFKYDVSGRRILTALQKAALRGIQVHLIIDGVGSIDFPEKHEKEFIRAGGQFHRFRPPHKFISLRSLMFRRLHRKIVSIDASEVFIGGMNIHDGQLREIDYTLRMNGPLCLRIDRFLKLFFLRVKNRWFEYFHELTHFKKLRRFSKNKKYSHRKEIKADFVVRDNFRHRREIEATYLNYIRRARESIDIANAYFIPGLRFRRALIQASKQGIKVRLFLQGRSDHPIVLWATRSLYDEFLSAGIEIFEHEQKILHAKVAVIDDYWVTVGSANLEIFSLFLNLEANIFLQSAEIAKKLTSEIKHHIENGIRQITNHDLRKRTIPQRVRSYLAIGLIKIIGILTNYR